ncbi:hypothetical protein SOPP22_05830 [Shewanella sp. OPT22]|nr:hypothetical protein SOPP22_05830 [Shewanella sp. OPT22]
MSVSTYEKRVSLFYAYRQILVDEGVIDSISEQPAFESGHNDFDKIVLSGEASGQLSEASISKIKAINTAYSEQGHIKLSDDVLAEIQSPEFILPSADALHNVIQDSLTNATRRSKQVEVFKTVVEDNIHQTLGENVHSADISDVRKALKNKVASILSQQATGAQDIFLVQKAFALYTAAKSIEQYEETGKSSVILKTLDSYVTSNYTDIDGLDSLINLGFSDLFSSDGEISINLSHEQHKLKISFFNSSDDSTAPEKPRTASIDLDNPKEAANKLIKVFDSLPSKLDEISFSGIPTSNVDLTNGKESLGLAAQRDLDTVIVQNLSNLEFREQVYDRVLKSELAVINAQTFAAPDNIDLTSALNRALGAFKRVGLDDDIAQELKSRFLSNSDFVALFDTSDDGIGKAIEEGKNKVEDITTTSSDLLGFAADGTQLLSTFFRSYHGVNDLAKKFPQHTADGYSENDYEDSTNSLITSKTEPEIDTSFKGRISQANDLFSFRNSTFYEGALGIGNLALGLNGLVNIGQTIEAISKDDSTLSSLDKGLVASQVTLGFSGITIAGAKIGLDIATKVSTSIAEESTNIATSTAESVADLAGSAGKYVPYAGLVIGALATSFAVGRNIKSAVEAGNAGNSAQVGFYIGVAALDALDLVVNVVGHVAEYIPVIGNIIGFIADAISLAIGIISQFIGDFIPDPNAQQNFDSLVDSDAFQSFVDDLGSKYAAEGYDVLDYQTDAAQQDVDNPYDDDAAAITKKFHRNLDQSAKDDPDNPFLRVASLDDTEGGHTLVGRSNDDLLIGKAGDDILDGFGGNDRLLGGIGNDTINAGDGDDIAIGGSGDDILKGGAGNDLLDPGTGEDIVDGGSGRNTLSYRSISQGFLNIGGLNSETAADTDLALDIDLNEHEAQITSNTDVLSADEIVNKLSVEGTDDIDSGFVELDGSVHNKKALADLSPHLSASFKGRSFVLADINRVGDSHHNPNHFDRARFGANTLGYSNIVVGDEALHDFNLETQHADHLIKISDISFNVGGHRKTTIQSGVLSHDIYGRVSDIRPSDGDYDLPANFDYRQKGEDANKFAGGEESYYHKGFSGKYISDNFFGNDPLVNALVENHFFGHDANVHSDRTPSNYRAGGIFNSKRVVDVDYSSHLNSDIFHGGLYLDADTGNIHFLNDQKNIYFNVTSDDLNKLNANFGHASADLVSISELVKTKTILSLSDPLIENGLINIAKDTALTTSPTNLNLTAGYQRLKQLKITDEELRDYAEKLHSSDASIIENEKFVYIQQALGSFSHDVQNALIDSVLYADRHASLETESIAAHTKILISDTAGSNVEQKVKNLINDIKHDAHRLTKYKEGSVEKVLLFNLKASLADEVVTEDHRGTQQESNYIRTFRNLLVDHIDKDVIEGSHQTIEDVIGSSLSDVIIGTQQDNTISGLGGGDHIEGGAGKDKLLGNEGDDVILGQEGSDSLYGGTGDDTLVGGAGNDLLVTGDGEDYVHGGEGRDTISFNDDSKGVTFDLADGANYERGVYGVENIKGSSHDDVLYGDDNDNVITAGKGNDSINARGGDDFIDAGKGADKIDGGSGNDTISFSSRTVLASGSSIGYLPDGALSPIYYLRENEPHANKISSNAIFDAYSTPHLVIGEGTRNALIKIHYSRITHDNQGIEILDLRELKEPLKFETNSSGNVLLKAADDKGNFTQLIAKLTFDGVRFSSIVDKVLLPNNIQVNTSKSFWVDAIGNGLPLDKISGVNFDLSQAASFEKGVKNIENVLGTVLKDNLTGDDGDNHIDGADGIDSIYGGGGDDVITLKAGTVDGGENAEGSKYGDVLVVASGQNINVKLQASLEGITSNYGQIYATGIETVLGNDNDNTIIGDGSSNRLIDGAGNDNIQGKGGNDTLISSADGSKDVFDGGAGDDIFITQQETEHEYSILEDTFHGGDGNDIFILNRKENNLGNHIFGDDGVDTVTFQSLDKGVFVRHTDKNGIEQTDGDRVRVTLHNYHEIASLNSIENIIGSNNDIEGDKLFGGNATDIFTALAGDDVIKGYGGDDLLDGGEGHDTIEGGEGSDTIVGDLDDILLDGGSNAHDSNDVDTLQIKTTDNLTVNFSAKGAVISSADKSVTGHNFESISTGSGDDNFYGDEQDNIFLGNDGDDLLIGASGDDTLDAGKGSNRLFGGSGDDHLSVTLSNINSNTESDQPVYLAGTQLNDTLFGSDGKDILYGAAGQDKLYGGTGEDWYKVGTGDSTYSKDGTDTYFFESNASNAHINLAGNGNTLDLSQVLGTLQLVKQSETQWKIVKVTDSETQTVASIELPTNAPIESVISSIKLADSELKGAQLHNLLTHYHGPEYEGLTQGLSSEEKIASHSLNRVFGTDSTGHIDGTDGDDFYDGGQGEDRVNLKKGHDTVVLSGDDFSIITTEDGGDNIVIANDAKGTEIALHGDENTLDLSGVSGAKLRLIRGQRGEWNIQKTLTEKGFNGSNYKDYVNVASAYFGKEPKKDIPFKSIKIRDGLVISKEKFLSLSTNEQHRFYNSYGYEDGTQLVVDFSQFGVNDTLLESEHPTITIAENNTPLTQNEPSVIATERADGGHSSIDNESKAGDPDKVNLLSGGDGQDTAQFKTNQNLTIDLSKKTASNNIQLENIESIIGGSGDDTITGGSDSNILDGGGGNDTIVAGDGDDVILGGSGQDSIDGGLGADTISFSTFKSQNKSDGVSVDLAQGRSSDGDTFSNIENILGSAFSDILSGDEQANRITGGAGDDIIYGLGGADYLEGGAGTDTIDAGRGADTIIVSDNDTVTAADGFDDFIISPTTLGATINPSLSHNRLDLRAVAGALHLHQKEDSSWVLSATRNGKSQNVLTIHLTPTQSLSSTFSKILLPEGSLVATQISELVENQQAAVNYQGATTGLAPDILKRSLSLNAIFEHNSELYNGEQPNDISLTQGTVGDDFYDSAAGANRVNLKTGHDTVVIGGADHEGFGGQVTTADGGDTFVISNDAKGYTVSTHGESNSLDLRSVSEGKVRLVKTRYGGWVLQKTLTDKGFSGSDFKDFTVVVDFNVHTDEASENTIGLPFETITLKNGVTLTSEQLIALSENQHYGYFYGQNVNRDLLTIDLSGYTSGESNDDFDASTIDLNLAAQRVQDNHPEQNEHQVSSEYNILKTTSDDDQIIGTSGKDLLVGSSGEDIAGLRKGDDIYASHQALAELVQHNNITPESIANLSLNPLSGSSVVVGGLGDDTLISARQSDNLQGGAGDDRLIALAKDVTLSGGDGNDTFIVNQQTGFDITGGAGLDILDASLYQPLDDAEQLGLNIVLGDFNFGNEQASLEQLGLPHQQAYTSQLRHSLFGYKGSYSQTDGPVFTKTSGTSGIEAIVGSNFDDTLVSDPFTDNIITAGGGRDTLIAVAGNNVLDGAVGDDTIITGVGRDTVIVGSGHDVIRTGIGQHTIRISDSGQADIDYGLAVFDSTSSGSISSSTLVLENINFDDIDVNFHNDNIELTRGDDVIVKLQNTQFDQQTSSFFGPSQLIFADGKVVSNVEAFIKARLNHESYLFDALIAPEDIAVLTGNNKDNLIIGNKSDNIIDGGNGNDTLVGGEGDDIYQIVADSGIKIIKVTKGVDSILIEGKLQSDINFSRNGDDLIIQDSASGKELAKVHNHFVNGQGIESIQFDDSSVVTSDLVLADTLHTLKTNQVNDFDKDIHQNVILEGGTETSSVNLTLSNLDNVLISSEFESTRNTFDLAGGDDVFVTNNTQAEQVEGGTGDDTFIVGAGAHHKVFTGGEGQDHFVLDSHSQSIIHDDSAEIYLSDVNSSILSGDGFELRFDTEGTSNGSSGIYLQDQNQPIAEIDINNLSSITFSDGVSLNHQQVLDIANGDRVELTLPSADTSDLISNLVQAAASFNAENINDVSGNFEDNSLNTLAEPIHWPKA